MADTHTGHTLIISDTLYGKLQASACKRGFKDIEGLLELWLNREEKFTERKQVVHLIDNLRKSLYEKYGLMADSTDLIRRDRER